MMYIFDDVRKLRSLYMIGQITKPVDRVVGACRVLELSISCVLDALVVIVVLISSTVLVAIELSVVNVIEIVLEIGGFVEFSK